MRPGAPGPGRGVQAARRGLRRGRQPHRPGRRHEPGRRLVADHRGVPAPDDHRARPAAGQPLLQGHPGHLHPRAPQLPRRQADPGRVAAQVPRPGERPADRRTAATSCRARPSAACTPTSTPACSSRTASRCRASTPPARSPASAAAACTATTRSRAPSSAAASSPAVRRAGPPLLRSADRLHAGTRTGMPARRATRTECPLGVLSVHRVPGRRGLGNRVRRSRLGAHERKSRALRDPLRRRGPGPQVLLRGVRVDHQRDPRPALLDRADRADRRGRVPHGRRLHRRRDAQARESRPTGR